MYIVPNKNNERGKVGEGAVMGAQEGCCLVVLKFEFNLAGLLEGTPEHQAQGTWQLCRKPGGSALLWEQLLHANLF